MTSSDWKKRIPRFLVDVILAATLAAAVVILFQFAPLSAETKCLASFLLALAALLVSVRIHTAGMCRADSVLRALRRIGSVSARLDRDSKHARNLEHQINAVIEDVIKKVRALEHDRRRSSILLYNMRDGIIAVDHDGIITLCNRAAGVILRRPRMAAPGTGVVGAKIEDADLHPEIARLAYDCIGTRQVLESEISLPGLSGRVVGLTAAPCPALSPGDDCAMIILRDISEIRRHEKNQREFVSNVSHELRTPITSVRATAEALLAGAKNDDQLVDRFLRTIVSESDRLSALIEDLMEIARRDSGIVKLTLSEVNVSELVENATAAVRPKAEEKGISLQIEVDRDLTARCDELQVFQLIRNLVDNAAKYTPEQGEVEVGAYADQRGLVIYVKDTGIGIPQGEVDRIFERFYRVDKARSRRMGGTGLGLAIVKEIVEAHGGTINVETQLGRGSKFTVILPQG